MSKHESVVTGREVAKSPGSPSGHGDCGYPGKLGSGRPLTADYSLQTEIIKNQTQLLGSLMNAMREEGQCRICERTYHVMDLAGGTCEDCRMNDEGRW